MNSVVAVIGGVLLAGSFGTGLWMVRREVLRNRARARLRDEEASDDETTRPRKAQGAMLHGRLGWSLALGGAVFVAGVTMWDWYLSAGIAMVAGSLAHVSFAALEKKRQLQLEEGLAEAIALVTSALRSGASPVDALERASRAVQGPAQPVLLELSGALRLGEDVDRALEALVERVPLESYRLFAIALGVQWRAGGSLERSLAVVARAVRDRVGVLEDVRGTTGDGRASGLGDFSAWERFTRCRSPRGRVVRDGGRVVYDAAPRRNRTQLARRAGQPCERVSIAWTP